MDDSLSGTTAVAVYLEGRDMWVANVGDSRAIIVQQHEGKLVARPLSSDQTPYRKVRALLIFPSGSVGWRVAWRMLPCAPPVLWWLGSRSPLWSRLGCVPGAVSSSSCFVHAVFASAVVARSSVWLVNDDSWW